MMCLELVMRWVCIISLPTNYLHLDAQVLGVATENRAKEVRFNIFKCLFITCFVCRLLPGGPRSICFSRERKRFGLNSTFLKEISSIENHLSLVN